MGPIVFRPASKKAIGYGLLVRSFRAKMSRVMLLNYLRPRSQSAARRAVRAVNRGAYAASDVEVRRRLRAHASSISQS